MFGKETAPTVFPDRLRSTEVPEQFRRHSLIAGNWFHTVPRELMNLVVDTVGRDRFDEEMLKLEFALGDVSGDHTFQIGFRDGQPIHSAMLQRRDIEITSAEANFMGLSLDTLSLEDRNSLMNERSAGPWRQARAYLGWLSINSEFVNEISQLISAHRKRIVTNGFPVSTRTDLSNYAATETSEEDFYHAVRRFCRHWQLKSIESPLLVSPLQPQLPSIFPVENAKSLERGMPVFEIPQISSVPGRGELSDIVDEALGHSNPQSNHLTDWIAIVDKSNASRSTLTRYERIFTYQYYMRILFDRHREAFHRKKARVREAFARFFARNYLKTTEDGSTLDPEESLRKDEAVIKKALGSKWLDPPLM